jgi:hypothetical protein
MSVNGPRPPTPGGDLGAIDTSTRAANTAAGEVSYFAVYRSDTKGNPEDGYGGICVGLFGELDEAIEEIRRRLADGYHVNIDQGSMSQAEWDALEDAPDDFVATRSPRRTERSCITAVAVGRTRSIGRP